MFSEQDILERLREVGAIVTDSHFVYTSGKHGSAYVNKDAIYPRTQLTCDLCLAVAQQAIWHLSSIETVIAPAAGGIILSQWTAYHLSSIYGREVMSVYAEKAPDGGGFVINRDYEKLVQDKNVLIVEDVLNTGGSARKVVTAVRRSGGNVLAVAALCNRGGVTEEDLGNPPFLYALAQVPLEAWDEAECPLCSQHIPINRELGKGREFLTHQQNAT